MNVMNRFTVKTLMRNKTRTIVTIIGVILSVSMLTAVTTFISSMQDFMVRSIRVKDGGWQAAITGLPYGKTDTVAQNDAVKEVGAEHGLGYAVLDGSQNKDKPYLYISELDDATFGLLAVNLEEGRLPKNNRELVIPRHAETNGGVSFRIGDTITLDIGERISRKGDVLWQNSSFSSEEEPETLTKKLTRTYTIVGICVRPSFEGYSSPGYTCITRLNPDDLTSTSLVTLRMTMNKLSNKIYETVPALAKNIGISGDNLVYHSDLLRYMGISDNDVFLSTLYNLAAILIALIMVGSISLIYNAFAISVSERSRQFGMLSGTGATSRQIRKSVFFEALVVSGIGIPLGLLAGVGGIGVTLYLLRDAFGSMNPNTYGNGLEMQLAVSVPALVIAAAVGMVTVFLSAYIPARRAAKMSAIEAIRQTADVKVRARQVKTSRITRKLFGIEGELALKNFKRNRRRYRTTVFSLVISIILFISATSFSNYLKAGTITVYEDYNYDIAVSVNSDTLSEADAMALYQKVAALESVERVSVIRGLSASCKVDASSVRSEVLNSHFYDGQTYVDEDGKSQPVVIAPDKDGKLTLNAIIYAVDDTEFRRYAKEAGLRAEEYLDAVSPRAIAFDALKYIEKGRYVNGRVFRRYPQGEITLASASYGENGIKEKEVQTSLSLDFLKTELTPIGVTAASYAPDSFVVILPESRFSAHFKEVATDSMPNLCLTSKDASKTETDIEALLRGTVHRGSYSISNISQVMNVTRNMLLILNVFCYGFITLMALITTANVFNTISTNVQLRRREFAMLKSVGMTKRGFNKMINFECIFYGLKALVIGLPISLAVTVLIHMALSSGVDMAFMVPWESIFIAVAGVFLIVFITMLYAMSRVRRENIIDALKNENL